jgi:hypothetical protein
MIISVILLTGKDLPYFKHQATLIFFKDRLYAHSAERGRGGTAALCALCPLLHLSTFCMMRGAEQKFILNFLPL